MPQASSSRAPAGAERVGPPQAAAGVRPAALCWTALPKARCTVLLLTNLGALAEFGGGGSANARLSEDVGLMVNVSPREAVGATFFVTVDKDGLFSMGGALRYRRWLPGFNSLELAVGVRGATNTLDRGAVMGMVKYNIGPYLGLVARPEIAQRCVVSGHWCSSTGAGTTTVLRVSAGVEVGSWPGAVVPVFGGLVGLIAFLASPPKIM
jgi:hypothetical protein